MEERFLLMLGENKKGAQKSPKVQLGYFYLIAAFIFLFNPSINIVDILPDFFGYLFLMRGLSKWADLCPNVSDAMESIGRLRWFMLLKILSVALVPFVDDTFVLIFVFAFGVIELMYVIPAAQRVFDGLEYFGTRFDCEAIFKGPIKNRRSRQRKNGKNPKAKRKEKRGIGLKDIRLLTPIFFIIKNAFSLFPELCSLDSGNIISGVQRSPAYYKPFLIELNVAVGATIGIIWLVCMISYIKRISKDTPFLERVLADYELEVGSNVGLGVRRRFRTCASLLIAGLAFLPNMWIDGVSIIPTFVGAAFIIAAMALIGRISKRSPLSVALTSVFAVVSALSFAVSFYFGAYFGIGDVYHDAETYALFNTTRMLSTLEYAILIAVVYLICRQLKKVVHTHLGAAPDTTDKRIIELKDESQRHINIRITAGFISFAVVAFINHAYLFYRADVMADIWLTAFIATLIWIFYMANTINKLNDMLEYKYM